jgi:hydrogenase nickel incorporation protein HypB
VLLINKIDYLDGSDFNLELLYRGVWELNPRIQVFEVSCKTGAGFNEWTQWLDEK